MRKVIALAGLLLTLVVFTVGWEYARIGTSRFIQLNNLSNLLTWIGLFGILSLGQAFVIIVGGIDLSVGSLTALVAVCSAKWISDAGMHPALALGACLLICAAVGLWHGLLIAKVRMQPFVVTLCGLFLYRGAARIIAGDTSQGFGAGSPVLRWLGGGAGAIGGVLPVPFVELLILAALAGAYLHFMPAGRHLFALGANEESARFSGVATHRLKIQAYILCSVISGVGGLLLAFKVGSVQASNFGNFYELYAIAGAVLGGCSLRGGSGNVLGVLLGASIVRVLRNLVVLLGIPSELEYVVIGGAILAGVFVDEVLGRRAVVRRARTNEA